MTHLGRGKSLQITALFKMNKETKPPTASHQKQLNNYAVFKYSIFLHTTHPHWKHASWFFGKKNAERKDFSGGMVDYVTQNKYILLGTPSVQGVCHQELLGPAALPTASPGMLHALDTLFPQGLTLSHIRAPDTDHWGSKSKTVRSLL